jgi:hypothetical protein
MTTTVEPDTFLRHGDRIIPDAPHQMRVMDHTGDYQAIWDPTKQDEVDAAKAQFRKLKGKGYLAYTVQEGGAKGEVIREFDPEAGKIIMTPPMAGG